MEEQLNIVDEAGHRLGSIGKLEAHEKGILHEAFSIFVFNSKGEMLLQDRAAVKYHSGGLWTNTCCGHPRFSEDLEAAAKRRLFEEMGLRLEMREMFSLIYQAKLDHGLSEHEFDHVFFAFSEQNPELNPEEAEGYAWQSLPDLLTEIETFPERYSYWLKEIVKSSKFLAIMVLLKQI